MKKYLVLAFKHPASFFILAAVLGSLAAYLYIKQPVGLAGITTAQFIIKHTLKPSPFNPEIAPSDSMKGKIATYSGVVKWQSRVATEAAQIKLPDFIQQGETLETGDFGRTTVKFPGVSRIILFSQTKLDFAQTLPANIVLVQGKGKVEYQKLGDKDISVRALHLLIEQLWGNVVVSMSKDDPTMTVDVRSGAVKIAYNDSQNISREETVNTGQWLVFDDKTREITLW